MAKMQTGRISEQVMTEILLLGLCVWLHMISAAVSSGAVTLTASAQSGGDVCFGDVVQLACSTRRDLTEYLVSVTLWRENAKPLSVTTDLTPWYSHQTINTSKDHLTINVTSSYFNLSMTYSYQCYYRFANDTDDSSGVFRLTVGDLPKPEATFTVVNSTTALLSASIGKGVCCTNYTILSNVTRSSNGTSTAFGEETSTTSSNFSRAVTLSEEYNYTAEVVFRCLAPAMDQHTRLVSVQGPGSRTTPPSTPSTGTTEPSATVTSTAGVVGGVVGAVVGAFVVVILVLLVAILLAAMVMYKRRKSAPPPTQPSRGEVLSYQDSKEEVSYQAVKYAELDFGKPSERPIKPPPLETVIYTEAGGTIALPKEEKPPKVPEKKKNMVATGKGAFVKDVLAVMDGTGVLLLADNGSCIRDDCSEGKCDHKKLQAFRADAVARYKDITFAANCLEEPGVEVSKKDVQRIIAIRKGLDVDKALLICNQEFMSMDLLIDLEKERCFFVPTANHGKEGWDNTFLSKFTALFA